jgi:hypothetical protein
MACLDSGSAISAAYWRALSARFRQYRLLFIKIHPAQLFRGILTTLPGKWRATIRAGMLRRRIRTDGFVDPRIPSRAARTRPAGTIIAFRRCCNAR